MHIFREDVDFDHLLRDVVIKGYAFAPHVLTQEFLDVWELEALGYQFESYRSAEGAKVFEANEVFRCRPLENTCTPLTRRLAEEFGWRVRLASVAGANNGDYYPNDANILRYNDSSKCIGKHRDYSHDLLLIGGFTMQGYGLVECFGDDKNNIHPAKWHSGPGSLMLLRGPGLCQSDGRPYHQVHPPVFGERTSLVLRMSQQSYVPPNKEGVSA